MNTYFTIFREPYLLYHDTIHTDLRKFQVTTVISHEFSHQVFMNE